MSIKVLNEKIFTNTWCPLFGELPLFRGNIPNTSIGRNEGNQRVNRN